MLCPAVQHDAVCPHHHDLSSSQAEPSHRSGGAGMHCHTAYPGSARPAAPVAPAVRSRALPRQHLRLPAQRCGITLHTRPSCAKRARGSSQTAAWRASDVLAVAAAGGQHIPGRGGGRGGFPLQPQPQPPLQPQPQPRGGRGGALPQPQPPQQPRGGRGGRGAPPPGRPAPPPLFAFAAPAAQQRMPPAPVPAPPPTRADHAAQRVRCWLLPPGCSQAFAYPGPVCFPAA